jgi:hypothetical protein
MIHDTGDTLLHRCMWAAQNTGRPHVGCVLRTPDVECSECMTVKS